MAARAQHVQDISVAERRLRPIYEWLDTGNNKKALQECDKVLKKTPNLHCAKALKALAVLRIGKESECVAILNSLTAENPCDDATLQAMTFCYQELQQLDKICKLYETAVKLDPTNEELHTHLFMSYVRIFDFKSQQKSAMSLYKLKPKNPYYCWAVMSIILQATRGEGSTDAKKRDLLLSLAERMMNKLITDNKLEAEQEVQLYLMVLELLGKYEEIVQALEGPLGERLVSVTPSHNRLPYLAKLERWNDVNLMCKGVLIDSVDKWDIWKAYINSVCQLTQTGNIQVNNHVQNHEGSGENDLDVVDDTPEKAHEFICRLVENGTDNGYLLRGPYLARFELCSRLSEKDIDTTDLLGDTTELFIEYFRKFGHKPCCVSDLRIYLNLLDSDKKADLATRLMKDIGISDTSVPQSEQQMQRHICALQLSRLCGSHRNLSPEHLKAMVTALSLHYQHGYQTYGMNVLSTDQGPADAYDLVAAHVLYDLAQTTQKYEPIFLALVLLENLLKNSPSNFHAKLLCVRLYHTLGGGIGAQKMYDSLDVKHLQLDSLGYIHCARLPTTGLLTEASNLYDTTLKFFTSNYKDSSDHLKFSYKFGSFLKLDEFMDFRERLNNSLHYTTIAVDRIFLNLVQCTSSNGIYNIDTSPKHNNIDWDKLTDNHDLGVYISWNPERIEGHPEKSEEIALLFEQDVHFLKLRMQIIYAISASIEIVKSTDGTRLKSMDSLRTILEDWEKMLLQVAEKKYVPIRQSLVTLPLPSRLHCHLNCPYFSVIGGILKLMLSLAVEDVDSSNNVIQTVENCLKSTAETIKNVVEKCDDFLKKREVTEQVVNVIEIACISVLLCTLCSDLVQPRQGKKGKKKAESKMKDVLTKLNVAVKEHLQDLDDVLQNWSSGVLDDDISTKLEMLHLNNTGQSDVLDNLVASHKSAVLELQMVLKSKMKLHHHLLA